MANGLKFIRNKRTRQGLNVRAYCYIIKIESMCSLLLLSFVCAFQDISAVLCTF